MKYLTLVAALASATPAMAFHGAMNVVKFDEPLSGASLSEADMTKVKALRVLGEEQHSAGDHAASVATLAEAMAIFGIN